MIVGFIKDKIEFRIVKADMDNNKIYYRDLRMGTSEPDFIMEATSLINQIRAGECEAIFQ